MSQKGGINLQDAYNALLLKVWPVYTRMSPFHAI